MASRFQPDLLCLDYTLLASTPSSPPSQLRAGCQEASVPFPDYSHGAGLFGPDGPSLDPTDMKHAGPARQAQVALSQDFVLVLEYVSFTLKWFIHWRLFYFTNAAMGKCEVNGYKYFPTISFILS